MVSTFSTVHRFYASRDDPGKLGFLTVVPVKRDIFARFITRWEKQILARVIGIGKENKG